MIMGLAMALLWILKVILVLAVLAILVIGADYVYYEFQQAKKNRPLKVATTPISTRVPDIEYLRSNSKAQKAYHDKSEEDAWEGFFETTYIRGFETNGSLRNYGVKAPSRKAFRFFNLMDELAEAVAQNQKDASIFEQTEEL